MQPVGVQPGRVIDAARERDRAASVDFAGALGQVVGVRDRNRAELEHRLHKICGEWLLPLVACAVVLVENGHADLWSDLIAAYQPEMLVTPPGSDVTQFAERMGFRPPASTTLPSAPGAAIPRAEVPDLPFWTDYLLPVGVGGAVLFIAWLVALALLLRR